MAWLPKGENFCKKQSFVGRHNRVMTSFSSFVFSLEIFAFILAIFIEVGSARAFAYFS